MHTNTKTVKNNKRMQIYMAAKTAEKIVGRVQNAQVKPPGEFTKKTCDLLITNRRIVCIVLGGSVFTNAMVGQAIAGVPGAIAFGDAAQKGADKKRGENSQKDIDLAIAKNPGSFDIKYESIEKGEYNTSFFATLGMFAQIIIKNIHGETIYLDTPDSTKNNTKLILAEATDKIVIK